MFMNVLDVETDETKFTWNDSFRGSVVPPFDTEVKELLICFASLRLGCLVLRMLRACGTWIQSWIQMDPTSMSEVCLGYLEFQAGDAADSSRAWYTRARGGVQGWAAPHSNDAVSMS